MTEERIVHEIGKEIVSKEGLEHSDMVTWYNGDQGIDNFEGCVEVPTDALDGLVPESFPCSSTVLMMAEEYKKEVVSYDELGVPTTTTVVATRMVADLDEDGEVQYVQKTWNEYCSVLPSKNEGKSLLLVGGMLMGTCRQDTVKDAEFRVWAAFFGVANLQTKSEMKALFPITEDS